MNEFTAEDLELLKEPEFLRATKGRWTLLIAWTGLVFDCRLALDGQLEMPLELYRTPDSHKMFLWCTKQMREIAKRSSSLPETSGSEDDGELHTDRTA